MLDNDELISTRKLHGQDDGLYEETSDKNVANIEKDSVIAHKFAIMQQQLEQKDKRIQELEKENNKLKLHCKELIKEKQELNTALLDSISVQKVIVRINYYDERIKHAKQMRDKEQEEFYIDLKRAFNKLLEENK